MYIEMTNHGIVPDPKTCDAIITGYVEAGKVSDAISFVQHAYNQVNVISSGHGGSSDRSDADLLNVLLRPDKVVEATP